MEERLFDIHKNMIYLGEQSLKHANHLANYINIGYSDHWDILSVLQAAHAMEIFIKARIAQEHPLLILDKYPKESSDGSLLNLSDLMNNATTIQYKDLPARLWAATGIKVENVSFYKDFGMLRNKIQHLGIPEGVDFGDMTNRYVYEVIHPFIFKCWGLFSIDYIEDENYYEDMVSNLIEKEVKVVISPGVMGRIYLTQGAQDVITSGSDYSKWFYNEMDSNGLDINSL
ncbi:MAG: hypothetical protein E6559_16505 [Pantoea sp.]|uniref:hypothetical protein n=1 Tax=Enterobacter agglomerans TaxID=549 RepID=UPI002909F5A1|nr:hypothetical protein [Pantoea sp.]